MAGRTPRQAATNFITPVQRALSCVTNARIDTPSGYDPTEKHALVVNGGAPVTVQTDKHVSLGVSVLQNYRIVESDDDRGPWKVKTTMYAYTLHDDQGNEIVAYHWHPGIGPRYPHVHFRASLRPEVAKAHFPTGRVSLEQFLRLLIVDFKVEPRRASWKNILSETQATFEKWRTWN